MLLAWDNLADGATVAAGSELASLPAANVQHPHLAKKWATGAGVKSSHLTFDMGASVEASVLAVLGMNVSDAATFRLRASDADSGATTNLLFDSGIKAGVASGDMGSLYEVLSGQIRTLDAAVMPSLAIDCLSGGVKLVGGPAALTFTRAGATATRVNESGLIEVVAADTPRIDHDPVTRECRGLLIEEARTNLCLRSEEFNNASWTKVDTTITADDAVAPDGARTAELCTEGTAGSAVVQQTIAATANASYALSMFVKRGTHDWLRVQVQESGVGNDFRAWFNLTTGAVGTTTATGTGAFVAASIIPYRDGWYRLTIVGTVGNGATTIVVLTASAAADGSTTRVPNARRYQWGAQFENQAGFASSYIPTTSASVGRSADVATVASLGDWFRAAAGSVLAEWQHGIAASARIVDVGDGTSNQFMALNTSGATLFAQGTDGGVSQWALNLGATTVGAIHRAAFAYSVNDIAASKDGSAPATDTSATLPTVTLLALGKLSSGTAAFLNGHLRYVAYYPYRLTNAQLQAALAEIDYTITARYWRLDLADASLPDNLQVGRVFLGPHWALDDGLQWNWGVASADPSETVRSRGGQLYADVLPQRRVLSFALDYQTEVAMYGNAFAMARAAGAVKEVLAIPMEDGDFVAEQAVWGTIVSRGEPIYHRLPQIFRQRFQVEESL